MPEPLERQARAYRDNGIKLATNTMANWMIKSADHYLSLLYDRLHELIYENHIIHADETPVKVMRIDNNKIKNGKKTYMWVYRNRPTEMAKPIVPFDWQPSRKADHPRDFLKNFSGTVITDGYQVYPKLGRERDNLDHRWLLDTRKASFCRLHQIAQRRCGWHDCSGSLCHDYGNAPYR